MFEVSGIDKFLHWKYEEPKFNARCVWKRKNNTCMLAFFSSKEVTCPGEHNCRLRKS